MKSNAVYIMRPACRRNQRTVSSLKVPLAATPNTDVCSYTDDSQQQR